MTTDETDTCPITGQPLPDGYHLHPTLTPRIRRLGRDLALIVPDAIDVALGLRKQTTNTPTQTTRASSILLNTRIYDDIQEMTSAITYWSEAINQYLHAPTRLPHAQQGKLITQHADQILRWHKAPTMLDEMEYSIKRCERLANPPYARALVTCPTCSHRMYIRPIRTHVTCLECETRFDTTTRKAQMWEQALYTWMPRDHAAAVVYLTTGREITRSQLQHWIAQDLVKPLGQRRLLQPNEIITAMRSKRPYKKRRNPQNT